MGLASLAALLYTQGRVDRLLVMYSINVFATFSLSMAGMLRASWRRKGERAARGDIALFGVGLVFCVTILAVTSIEKFSEGGWVTLGVTGGLVAVCFFVRDRYRRVASRLVELDQSLVDLPIEGVAARPPAAPRPIAAVMVGGYNGIGIHTLLALLKSFPAYFQHIVFVAAGTIDSAVFKGEQDLAALETRIREQMDRYVALAHSLGVPASARVAIGTDSVDDLEKLSLEIARDHPNVTFVAGQLIFKKETWLDRLLHNQTAYAVQKRLQWAGQTMIILPVRLR
jgi:K+ transporter